MGKLFFGDNLYVLRDDIKNESVDLVYLDPPFNSKRDYNVFLKTPKGHESDAQITAFDDTWRWGAQAEREFDELLHQSNTDVSEMIQSLRHFLKESDLMAYLTLMANRLVELHRVLKSTGSLYIHCDPTASHYLKIVLDTVFGVQNFQNEIIWKRTSSHSDAKRYPKITDTLLFYTKSQNFTWNKLFGEYDDSYIKSHYTNVDENGRRFRFDNLVKPKGSVGYFYTLLGCPPPPNGWRMPESRAEQWLSEGRIAIPPTGKVPAYKRFLDEMEGTVIPNLWTDISPVNSQGKDSLGYPTQKPEALLERIVKASSNEGDTVLDAYCGCGTSVAVAERLKRNWIGIDITYHSISLILKRMEKDFGTEILQSIKVDGIPQDMNAAKALANRQDDRVRKEFEKWAVLTYTNNHGVVNAKKGADKGVDGVVYFATGANTDERMIIQVKSGAVNRSVIAALNSDMQREQAQMAILITLEEPTKPMREEALKVGFYHHPLMGKDYPKIQIVTVRELIEENKRLELPMSHQLQKSAKERGKNSQIDMGL